MGKYFGTDGIRGIVNTELDASLAFKIGKACAYALTRNYPKRGKILVGKDTRLSGDMLESALIAGILSVGVDVELLGIIPTPAVAYLTLRHKAISGMVISASHNPFEYNGIKIFSSDGYKLPDTVEDLIEDLIDNQHKISLSSTQNVGKIIKSTILAQEEYVDFLVSTIDGDLNGLNIAVDCANGAASTTASMLFKKLNCSTQIRFYEPDGTNINKDCGSTHLDNLQKRMIGSDFDVGIAFDGDADRCLMIDNAGQVIDGDRIMAVCASDMHQKGKLRGNAFVATILSNMGLHAYAKRHGIGVKCANVGDRCVLETMRQHGYILGGEQSGHVIFHEYSTTGDGQLTAVQFLKILKDKGIKCSKLCQEIKRYPQVMINVSVPNDQKNSISQIDDIQNIINQAQKKLGDGRILVRPSGTEALIRVMCEAADEKSATQSASFVANAIDKIAKIPKSVDSE